jgi:hypothetical protein
MRVIKTFFRSLLAVVPVLVKPGDGIPEATLSDVKECANRLLRMLDLPSEPSAA